MKADKFWSQIDVQEPNACWPWLGWKDRLGYGRGHTVDVPGEDRAYRIAYILSKGAIPKGLEVRHTCDNPTCCNPKHLLLGTHKENMQDKDKRGRTPHGEKHCRAKLTELDVMDIYSAYLLGQRVGQLSDHYGMRNQGISNILRGKTWKHLYPQFLKMREELISEKK